ncbi:hypothetical protein [Gordonia hankookensis]|uniref:Uncharacterized protein n=1 Tax=Gordonia hankookensis TaxID=589403 RepID=A0ABR7W8H1_9ACTN|nr:hypothetical protein [Gordonia hankookensis]MBD1319121.1 hypothetical protein [Gordonia hankookensis]
MGIDQRSRRAGLVPVVVIVVVGMIAALSAFGGIASAAPGDPPPPMRLDDLGSSSTISLPGQQGETSLTLPVPRDLSPSALRGNLQLPAFVTGGSIDVLQGDRLISRTPLTTTPNAPIELPLRGVRVDRNAADIVLRGYLRAEGFCQFDADHALRITNTTVSYAGREAIPTDVADFLPPVLRGLTIYIPDDVKEAEGEAAVNLATAVVSNYGSAPVPIETVALPRGATPPTVPGPLERQIMISTDAPPGLSLHDNQGSAYLEIGGSPDELVTQTQFLTSSLAPIAMSSSAVAGALHSAPQIAPDVQNLSDLGVTNQSVTSAAWPSLTVGIDQTRMGRPSKGIRVQLTGSYSPGAPNADGLISVKIGDRAIATIPADESGTYDTWVDIPDDLLSRYTELTVTLEHGNLGETCGTGYRSTLSLSSAGEVQADEADPPQPSGFQSLPQALMPRTQLAWTKGDPADVARAVSIASGLQKMSAVPLGIDVVSMNDAGSSSQPAILISADGAGLPSLNLPLQSDGRTLKVVSGSGDSQQTSSVTLNPGVNFGGLEVTRTGDRSLLVATSTNDSKDLDALLDWLSSGTRWSAVDGDAILQAAGRDPVTVAADEVNAGAPTSDTDTATRIFTIVGVVAGGALLAGLVIFGTILLRRRRNRGSPTQTP